MIQGTKEKLYLGYTLDGVIHISSILHALKLSAQASLEE